jgi:F-type H+-transporting ATPase subunit gamma
MISSKEIKESLATISIVNDITEIYQEMANLRLKEISDYVLRTREFLKYLAGVYNHAKSAYIALLSTSKMFNFGKRGYEEGQALIKRNGREIVTLLSSNNQLYGPLILDIWKETLNYLKNNRNKTELAIVGKLGQYLAKESKLENKMFFFELEDDRPSDEKIKKIIEFLRNYEKITVFHGKFITFFNQIPVKSDVSGEITITEELTRSNHKTYLFEPSPQSVLEFFENEVIAVLFHQTILEHQLSKFGSRMIAMSQANQNAKEMIKQLEKEDKRNRQQLANRKQLEAFASSSLWK